MNGRRPPFQLHLPLPIPGGRLPDVPTQNQRWAELDARRPHARYLSIAEREEFERLDIARSMRNWRKAL